MNKNRLSAVINFGLLAAGDPACDLTIAWTYFDKPPREIFRRALEAEDYLWARSKSWALWKALIVRASTSDGNTTKRQQAELTIDRILSS
ncbi:MAG: phosphotransferase [Pseudomonadota bacterium]